MEYDSDFTRELIKAGVLKPPGGDEGDPPKDEPEKGAAASSESDSEDEVECSVCMDDISPSDAAKQSCCASIFCRECFDGFVLSDGKCPARDCGTDIDPRGIVGFDPIKNKNGLIVYAKKVADGWQSCADGGCNGGRPVAELDSPCSECGNAIVIISTTSNDIPVTLSDGTPYVIELSAEEMTAFVGSVSCPKCRAACQRSGGCSLLTCTMCKTQFQADGSPGKEHTESSSQFDHALGTLNERTSEAHLLRLLKDHEKWAAIFRLPTLIERVRHAHQAGEGGIVQAYLNLLELNPMFEGLIKCLHALYMPLIGPAAILDQHIAAAASLTDMIDALQRMDTAGAYAQQAADLEILRWLAGDGKTAYVGIKNMRWLKIKNKQIKDKAKGYAGV